MIVFFGPAGSGKSTQGRIIADKFGWKWLSVGQVLRDTGKFSQTLKEGGLVDDNEVIRLMNKEIEKADSEGINVVLDGYPRDITQAKWMDENEVIEKIELAIVLKVPKEELFKRIENRGREDDTKEVVERRFEVFEQNICSILPIMERKNVKIVEVDGVGGFDEITDELIGIIEENVEEAEVVEEKAEVSIEQSYGE